MHPLLLCGLDTYQIHYFSTLRNAHAHQKYPLYRVQRKSVLQLVIRASCSWPIRVILMNRIDYSFSVHVCEFYLPVGQLKNRNHLLDSKIYSSWAIGHDFLCTLIAMLIFSPSEWYQLHVVFTELFLWGIGWQGKSVLKGAMSAGEHACWGYAN